MMQIALAHPAVTAFGVAMTLYVGVLLWLGYTKLRNRRE